MSDRLGAALAYVPAPKVDAPGYVYVVRCQRFHKIGWSADPARRLPHYQVHNPYPVALVGTVPGTREDEAAWHREHAAKRVRGEWFRLTRDDVARILAGQHAIPSVGQVLVSEACSA